MNITFNLELSTSIGSKDEYSLLIRCTQDRKHRRIGTGISVSEKHWDKSLQKVKKNHPLSIEYNKLLSEKLKKITIIYGRLLQESDEVYLDDIVREATTGEIVNFFEFAYKVKLAEIKSRNKLGTYNRYDSVLNKFKAYTGSNLNMNRVNYDLLKKYELYMIRDLKNGRDTVSSNLSVLRAVINEAIRHGYYKNRNPFDQIQLKFTDNTKEKLTAEEFYRFLHNPIPDIPSLQLAKDFFIACFLAEGTRGGDMLSMQKENIINNCLVFNQQKTGKKMVIPVNPDLMVIFNRYIGDGQFIFPLLNNVPKVNEIIINSKLTYINKYLKEVAKYCGIFKKISTHVARHTYTDLALQVSNGNIYQVQQSLGHSSVKTTEIYSRNRVNYLKTSLLPEILTHIEKNVKPK